MSGTHPVDPPPARSFGERLFGTLKLDPDAFTEIEHDPSSLGQAAIVVTLAATAAGLGNAFADSGEGVALAIIGNLFAWAVSTAIIWLIGVAWLQHESDYPELLRTVGFATAPQALYVLATTEIGMLAMAVGWVWSLAAYIIAVREALDVSTGRAIGVCLGANLIVFVLIVTFLTL